MKIRALAMAAAFGLVGSLSAQTTTCGLTVVGDGTAGSTLSFQMQTDPGSLCILVISDSTASSPIVPGLTISVRPPWLTFGMGTADPSGFVQRDFVLPAGLTPASWFAEGVSANLVTVTFCATGAEPFVLQ